MNFCTLKRVNQRLSGVSLIELLVCLCIMCVLVTLGLPSFSHLIQKQKLKATATEFYAAVNLTRAEAIRRCTQVSLIALDHKDWNSGWKIIINESDEPSSNDHILFQHEPLTDTYQITHNFTDSSQTYISYSGQGRSRTNLSSQQHLAGTVSMTLGEMTKRIKVNFLGRARLCDATTDITCNDSQTNN